MDGSLIRKSVIKPDVHNINISNTDTIFIPLPFVEYCIDMKFIDEKIIDELVSSSRMSDGIFLEVIDDFARNGTDSFLHEFELLTVNVKTKKMHLIKSSVNGIKETKTITISDNTNQTWVEYVTPYRSMRGTVLVQAEDAHFVDQCLKMLSCMSVQPLLRKKFRKLNKVSMGNAIKQSLNLEGLSNDERSSRETPNRGIEELEL